MIELPRAALRASPISKYADFFSFGTKFNTNYITVLVGKFLNDS